MKPARQGSWVGIRLAALLLVLGTLCAPAGAQLVGPGLPKMTWPASDLFQPISIIISRDTAGNARGNQLVTMHKGWLAVPFATNGGGSGGGFEFYDISNPRAPQLVSRFDVPSIREPHSFVRSSSYPGDYVVFQQTGGIEFWDWTDIRNPVLLNRMTLPGAQPNDYGTGVWWLWWQAPYVYVGGTGNGIYIVNATDPRNPTLVKQIPISETGGFRINNIFAVGNLLVANSTEFTRSKAGTSGVVTMDISDPANPVVIKSQSSGFPAFYSTMFNGNKLFAAPIPTGTVQMYDLSNPAEFKFIAEAGNMSKAHYCSIQDNYVHATANYTKLQFTNTSISVVGESGSGGDIVSPLGNLVFDSSDGGNGSRITVHQLEPDNLGPSVTMVNPPPGATSQKVTSRVGITLSDWVLLETVNTSTFIVRKQGTTTPLSGKYSGDQGILNFWPDQPLQSNTNYEVVIPAGGIKDFSGNGLTTTFTSTFSTGSGGNSAPSVTVRRNAPAVVNTTVSFDVQSVSGSQPITYSWDFGDGTAPTAFSTSSSASHTYAAPGHYQVTVTARNDFGQDSDSFTQTIHHPLTASKPTASSTIIVDGARSRVWVVNPDTHTVAAVDSATLSKQFEKPVGVNPRTLAQAPGGTIWVVNQHSATISVLNPDTGELVQTISLPSGSLPYGIAFAPNGGAAYVTAQGAGKLFKLSPSTREVTGTLSLNFPVRGVAVSADSARVLVTRFISPIDRGEVVEVSSSMQLIRTFALAFDSGPDSSISGRGVPNYISSITISPDGRQARVPGKKDNTARGQWRDGQSLTFETTVRTIASKLDLSNNTEVLADRIDLNDRDMASAVVYSNLGDYIFVSTQGTNALDVFDAYDGRFMTGVSSVGLAPQGLALSADGKRLFTQNFMSRSVSAYDVSGVVDSTTNAVTKVGEVSTVASETLAANVLKGKQIFYNADDRRMNLDGYISCASCHLDGGSDQRVWDFTQRGEGVRNTISLLGRGGVLEHGPVHWTGNFDEIQDFENDIRNEFGGTGLMTDTDFNATSDPLGSPKAGRSADLDALAAFVTSLTKVNRSPYRNPDGTMTADAQAGKVIFESAGCLSCHSGPEKTDSALGVLHDVGTITAASGKRIGQTLTGFDTPSLIGVWETAPYLHDGSAATLLDVITTKNVGDRHGVTSNLTTTERNQLVAYLQQLDESDVGSTRTIPNAPGNLIATAASSSQINLSWSDNSADEDGFDLQRATDSAFSQNVVTTSLAANATSYQATGLSPSTTYYFRVRAFNSAGTSAYSNTASATTQSGPASGDGLTGAYHNGTNFETLMLTRIDPTVNFNWASSSPDSLINADNFSVRWTGKVVPLYGETYTFYAYTDDGVRLWVNGQQIINNWRTQRAKESKGTITLQAGVKYDIVLEYFEGSGNAQCQLSWSSSSQAKQIIPQSQLFSQ